MPSLKILRELSQEAPPDLVAFLTDARLPADDPRRLFAIEEPARKGHPGRERWFVENDIPRESAITDGIVENTLGFVIVDDDGNIVRETKSLQRAESAISSAKFSFNVDIDFEDEGPEPVEG